MKKRNIFIRRMASVVLSAALAATMLPVAGVTAGAQEQTGTGQESAEQNDLRLWYTKPSSQGGVSGEDNVWQQYTLPIGNGDMGANVYGEISNERLTFNEKTLWTGGPSESRPDYNGGNLEAQGKNGETMKQIQQLFAEGKDSEASSMCNQLVGTSEGYGAYQSWGNIYLTYNGIDDAAAENYVRDLDIRTAVSSVNYDVNGTHYSREYFVSNPDNVLVARLTAEGGDKLNLDITFPSNQGGATVAEGDTLLLAGEVSDNQMKYDSVLKAVPEGGEVTADGDTLTVSDADAVTVYVSADTDYKNEYPAYRTGQTAEELHAKVAGTVEAAAEKGFDAVKADHIADYSSLFSRVELDLGQTVSDKPTDELLAAYNAGTATAAEQRQLEVILFQYGRYLTLGSSRENSELPSNLQGVWNNKNNPSWSSDYHMNVNLQMNYWPTYSTNLAECAEPLIDYVDSLREPGRITAAIYAGIASEDGEENGFMAHTQNTPFGWTCPGWDFSWGWSPAAVPWILQNCWEYYEFTGDYEYMETYIYPMLKEEAKMYSAMLVKDEDGKYVSSPTFSPETGPRTNGNTYEQSLIWQLFTDAITAGKLVGEDEALLADWQEKLDNLKGPIEIGDDGQVKEWYIETSYNKDENGNTLGEGFGHRHLSHMLGLFPGDLITADTPEWYEAARVSMNLRTDSSTGWGMGQRINTWARLGDGNRAHKLITDLFANGIYANMWDTHPPYQIDGNFGMTSGVAEMLLQSNAGYINLLPALPDVWENGSVDGLVARGNFEISMAWDFGRITTTEITANNGGECKVLNPWSESSVGMKVYKDGQEVATTVEANTLGDVYTFQTEAGAVYELKPAAELPAIVDIVESEEDLFVEDTLQLNVRTNAEDGIVWSSSDDSIATVENGLVVPKKIGDVTITAAQSGNEAVSDSCVIHVVAEKRIDSSLLSAVADSEENTGGDGPAGNAVDGNESTIWHSGYSAGKVHPDIPNNINNSFTIDLGDTYTVGRLDYVPRPSGSNGDILGYELWYSTEAEGEDFVKLTEGTWESSKDTKTAVFDPVECRRIRLRAMSTVGGDQWISAAEFYVYKTLVQEDVSKNTLEYFLNKAKGYVEDGSVDDCVESIRKLFAEAIAEGEAVMADEYATREEVTNATVKLMRAIHALNMKPGDKTDLEMAVELGDSIDLTKYVEAGQAEFTEALAKAKEVLADGDAFQEDIDNAWNALVDAISNLRLKADKSVLEDLINEANGIDTSLYTEESVAAFRAAFTAADAVLADETLSEDDQAKVDEAANALSAAIDGLTAKADSGDGDNGNTGGSNNGGTDSGSGNESNTGNSNGSSSGNSQKAAKTGDETMAVLPAVGIGLSLILIIAAAAAFMRRKQR
ncbi:MAG TPA: glycoside hydrolase N-terminal domain-containing protein [Candidatus Mediterraneibacter stercorigallinarum]|uniref:Glycoside hydrolase N-terminal domain-containing protein n=1 Tax=Candidatus Mediterraneibacter stercorigallinarum TaxID=2838686 RepID=A0A9D2DAG6_9FIRM|nr:glycoside hydrolase N-terminal domain-containing protein [Candidatus Mediterraneibacter stercorigallinarum]